MGRSLYCNFLGTDKLWSYHGGYPSIGVVLRWGSTIHTVLCPEIRDVHYSGAKYYLCRTFSWYV